MEVNISSTCALAHLKMSCTQPSGKMAQDLAVWLFDLGVNCGTGNAVKFLQGALPLL